MAPISDRTFEVSNATRYRLHRLFLTGIEVTQAVQHFGSASHLTDSADQHPDNSLRLVSGKPACVRVYVAGRDVPPVSGTLEVWRRSSGFIWTSIANLAPEPPGEVTAVANPEYAHVRGTLDATLNFIIPSDLMCGTLRLVAAVSAGRWTDTTSDGHPVVGERCCWTVNGEDVGRGVDIRVMAPAEGRHEATLSVDDGSGTPVVATTSFVTLRARCRTDQDTTHTKRNATRAAGTSARRAEVMIPHVFGQRLGHGVFVSEVPS